jgi:hypothetical protein
MRYAGAICFAWTIGIFASSNANALTGIELYQSCKAKTQSVEDAACNSYIDGFVDGMYIGFLAAKKDASLFCPPNEGIPIQVRRLLVEKYLREQASLHPDKLHQGAGLLIAGALMDAYPCP